MTSDPKTLLNPRRSDAGFRPCSAMPMHPISRSRSPRRARARKAKAGMQRMPITWLKSGMFQPRRHFDEEALQELANSIRERGILEPLAGAPVPGARQL